jgi:UDP-GlcNAc:undecaprenyl-phosphate/decaprenyl-phosphate GlcNAc-1-phosphate transferase
MQLFLLLGVTSFLLSLILTPLSRNLFRRLGVFDHPGEDRKIHLEPIPRIGGIPLILSLAISFSLLRFLHSGSVVGPQIMLVWRLLPAALLMFVVGLLDDLFRLRPWQKLAGQLAAAAWAYWVGVRVLGVAGYSTENWWSLPVTLFWLALCTNAFNLIDGVDGLSAGLGLFATLTMLVAALTQNNVLLALAIVPLAGCLLGFLRYNFNPATVFLGDSGSLLIGFLLGCYGVIWMQKTATLLGLVAPMMALFVPLLDVGLSVVRRFLRHQPIFTADRGHIHHRLLDRGLTPRRAVLVLYAFCSLGAIFSLLQTVIRNQYAGLVVLLFCAAAWLGVQNLGYVEFSVTRKMVLGGAFRRLIDAQIQLRQFEQALDASNSQEECWETLLGACRTFGFAGVKLCFEGQTLEQIPSATPGSSYWTLRISLSDRDYIHLTRAHGADLHTPVLAPLVDIIHSKLSPKLSSFEWRPMAGEKVKVMSASAD